MSMDEVLSGIRFHVGPLGLEDKISAINTIKKTLHELSPLKGEPVDCVTWVRADLVSANDYNPNAVAPPEMVLLHKSVGEDGYTQPIVAWEVDGKYTIVDGFHRSRVGKEYSDIKDRLHGYLPVTVINRDREDIGNRMASTIRHNRARGKHSVDAMSEIVLELKARNWKTARICKELGMEEDEVLRLCQITGLSGLFSDTEFSQAWESDTSSADTELDFSADFEAITQNTNDKDRIFHTVDKWEAVAAGFFAPTLKGRSKDDCEQEYCAFLSSQAEFSAGIEKVFSEWPNSCEHNLTNKSMNRIAWIGQAAACAARGLPSAFRGGFALLTERQQSDANQVALDHLNRWLVSRGFSGVMMDEAIAKHRDHDLF
jgi:ParB-like chromosome segregation protein Spo0J